MIEKIYKQIQENNKITFDNLFKLNNQEISTKAELGTFLRVLEKEKKIFQYSNEYYDLESFPTVSGFVQWNMTGFCWLSEDNQMNSYGITFDPSDNLLSIYNKRDAMLGTFVEGKKVTLEERTFVFITNTTLKNEVKLIATYQAKKNHWVILNSNTNFSFPNTLENITDGQVSIFNSLDNKKIEDIGNINNNGIESEIIRILGDIEHAPEANFSNIENNSIKNLNKPFYTIDSLYTKDIDDAIYIEKTANGYKLFVAIADVSSYVIPGDNQDKHAEKVCSSFYLPHETVHMLDRKLAENFCSLNPGVKKQAMVCEMDFDDNGVMLQKDFYVANILSQARLTYNDVDRIINNENPSESLILENKNLIPFKNINDNSLLVDNLFLLSQFSKTQERNIEKSYWVVEQPEYHLGENGKIDFLYPKDERNPSQLMVESAMLAANIAAAQFIHEKYPEIGMFRNQFKPEEKEMPKPAFYDFNNQGHWGLQTNFYTHFTSPIRRYCDLLVHRMIKQIISNEPKLYSNEKLNNIANQINLQQYKSKQYAIKAKNLLMPQYIENLFSNKNFNEELTVLDFSRDGIVVNNKQLIEMFIPAFKLEKDIVRAIDKLLPEDETQMTLEEKRNSVEEINKQWQFFMRLVDFTWTDERKTAYYQITKKKSFNKKLSM